jgi:hypothetical protein
LGAEKLAKRHIFVDKRDQIRFKGGNIERKHNPTGLCTELQKIFIFYNLDNNLEYFWRGIKKRLSLNDGLYYRTNEAYKLNKVAKLLKDISLDLHQLNDDQYVVEWLRDKYQNSKLALQNDLIKAFKHYINYHYIPKSMTSIAQLFLDDLRHYFNKINCRRIDVDRTTQELTHYGLRVAKKQGFPTITLNYNYKTEKVIEKVAEDKFAEILDDHNKSVKFETERRSTKINSYYLVKAIWEITQRLNSAHELNKMIFWTVLRFVNREQLAFTD